MTNRPALEVQVERVAETLVRRDPTPFLRTRVLTGLDAAPTRRLKGRAWWALALTGGAAAILLAVAGSRVPELPAVATVALTRPTTPTAAPADDLAFRMPVHVRPARAVTTSAAAATDITDAERAWQARAIPALPALGPLDVSVSQPDELSIPLLSVPTVTIAPVVVPPLDPARWSRDR